MDREAWHAAVHGVTKNQTRLSHRTELIDKALSVQMLLSLVPSFPIIYVENSTALNIIININKLLKRRQHSLCSNYTVRLWSKKDLLLFSY